MTTSSSTIANLLWPSMHSLPPSWSGFWTVSERHVPIARAEPPHVGTAAGRDHTEGDGCQSWRDVLAIRWRISTSEAGRRLEEAAKLAPRRGFTGASLEPALPCTAIARARGLINREHGRILHEAMKRVPAEPE